ncbi:hypothetical protein T11_12433 [Trichinella zimbabwensis]|uniref:Uncharacterized protein n=1 Tax=Trichinella zimbabwensis TaxID=268475 RepID=A0A0V1H6W2_9BILA|nr:hypothetical protein T11_12433 [Trichinella zimbabwensis]
MRCSKIAPMSDVVIKSFDDHWAEINMLKFGVELALCENGLGQADEGKGKAAVSQLTAAS